MFGVVFNLRRFAWGEILAKLSKISPTSPIGFHDTEKLAHYEFTLNFMFCIKQISIEEEKNDLQLHMLVMTPVCTHQSVMKCKLLKKISPYKRKK